MKKLTGKQARFVSEYLIDLNASQAVLRAGYKVKRPDAQGYDLLRKPEIQAAVQQGMKERCSRTEISADRVLRELARVAFSDLRNLMSWGPGGICLRESSELADDVAATVAEVSETTTRDGGTVRVKVHGKLDALDKLCKHLGIYESEEAKRIREDMDELRKLIQI